MIFKKILNERKKDRLLTEAKSKAQMELINNLHKKWSRKIKNLTLQDTEKIYDAHKKISNNINPDQQAVKIFLNRHDGKHGFKKYKIENLKDISTIEINDLLNFLKESSNFQLNVNENDNEETFKNDNFKITPEKIESSKNMWFDDNTAIINEENFRVYDVDSQKKSIRMGYYYQEVFRQVQINRLSQNKMKLGQPWCITWRGENANIRDEINGQNIQLISNGSNLYKTYRNSTSRLFPYKFYFVIDTNYDPMDETNGKYYMSSIAVQNDGRYRLISMYNDGENYVEWKDIVKIYPKIAEYENLFQFKNYSESEDLNHVQKTILDTIVDTTNDNPNVFWRQNYDIKKEYIERGGYLKTAKAWESLTSELRKMYIDTMEVHNAYAKVSTTELFEAIFSNNSNRNSLDRRLKILGLNGVSYLSKNLIRNLYLLYKKSQTNNDIGLYFPISEKNLSDNEKTFTIFDTSQNNVFVNNNVTYDNFKKHRGYVLKDNNQNYIVAMYTKGNEAFFTAGNVGNVESVYFFTKETFFKFIDNDGRYPREIGRNMIVTDFSKMSGNNVNNNQNVDTEIDNDGEDVNLQNVDNDYTNNQKDDIRSKFKDNKIFEHRKRGR